MRILLLTDMPPCTNYTAGIVLDQLCRLLPEDSLSCYALLSESIKPVISEDLKWIPMKVETRPREMAWRPLPRGLGDLTSWAMESYNANFKIKAIASKVVKFAKEFKAQKIWCILEGQTLIRLASEVARQSGIPLLTQVWDPPTWWIRENRLDNKSAREILKTYDRVLSISECCAAASWAMAESYHKVYNLRTVPLLPGINKNLALPVTEPRNNEDFVIGMAGQIYASDEWDSLISALDQLNWRLNGRKVRIRVLGKKLSNRDFNGKVNIEFLGWHSQVDTIKVLAETDVLYCPYWFDTTFKVEASLCFPSKLITYLATGRPVIFHGPEYASPARFIVEHNAGLCCNSLNVGDIVESLTKIASNKELYTKLAQDGRAAFDKFFTLESMRKNLAEFLEIEESSLKSIS